MRFGALVGPVYCAVGVNLNNSAVERDYFNFDRDQTFPLESFKNHIEYSVFTSLAHVGINGMAIIRIFWQDAQLVSVFDNVQCGINDLKALLSHISSLSRKAVCDALILFFGNIHGLNITHNSIFYN